jgi:rRNA maturation endonuclease Nob1
MGSLHELGTSSILLALVVAVLWAVRRFSPPFRCPQCGSVQLIFLMDKKECARCGHWFD